jgi:hypothetical protein
VQILTRVQIKMMMEGLIATAVEKIRVLGWEDAKEDVQKIVEMVEDIAIWTAIKDFLTGNWEATKELEMFWDSDGELTETDWVAAMLAAIENAGGEVAEL